MKQPTETVIQVKDLSKSYKKIDALKSLNLAVRKNSIFGFLGPNGAGKTTTIKLLLGLIQPTNGSGTIFGHDIVEESIAIRKKIGYLPQDPRFYDYMTAYETLDFTARFFFDGPEAEIKNRVKETLDLVGLADKADRPIKTFSGGERQRLGIGQAQVNYPDLLILDEPAASLDPLGRRDVLKIMELLRKYATIFYSTHILDDVQRVSDTVAILNNGELVTHGPIEDLLAGSGITEFIVKIKGNATGIQKLILDQSWVTQTQATEMNGETTLVVSVNDAEKAETQLARLFLVDETIVMTEFRRKTFELEEIFMEIVEGGKNVRE
ncbi:MAG: ATP-binding cassette domain-containing protein [Anaerolineales bacterium]|nr:ATP-binding cassette domain-containing protein [Anaerolineales bacterium]